MTVAATLVWIEQVRTAGLACTRAGRSAYVVFFLYLELGWACERCTKLICQLDVLACSMGQPRKVLLFSPFYVKRELCTALRAVQDSSMIPTSFKRVWVRN